MVTGPWKTSETPLTGSTVKTFQKVYLWFFRFLCNSGLVGAHTGPSYQPGTQTLHLHTSVNGMNTSDPCGLHVTPKRRDLQFTEQTSPGGYCTRTSRSQRAPARGLLLV